MFQKENVTMNWDTLEHERPTDSMKTMQIASDLVYNVYIFRRTKYIWGFYWHRPPKIETWISNDTYSFIWNMITQARLTSTSKSGRGWIIVLSGRKYQSMY